MSESLLTLPDKNNPKHAKATIMQNIPINSGILLAVTPDGKGLEKVQICQAPIAAETKPTTANNKSFITITSVDKKVSVFRISRLFFVIDSNLKC